jgi:hypothetical protein
MVSALAFEYFSDDLFFSVLLGDLCALVVNLSSKRRGRRKLDPEPLQRRLRRVGIGGNTSSDQGVLMLSE